MVQIRRLKTYQKKMCIISALLCLFVLVSSSVTTDSRSIVVDGKRELLLAGSIHYPRSTPEMWEGLFAKTKAAGLNAVDTYVFWDIHEPERGKYDFTGNKNLRLFLKKAQDAGLYVILRIGPYVCAEWNFGGLPAWLREISGIDHRGYNPAFIHEMTIFVSEILGLVQGLLHNQGGPIVLLQIENEYGNFIEHYPDGQKYIEWATEFAQNSTSAVPWFVCVLDRIKSILNTCNGFYCDSYRESRPFKDQMLGWTENWSGWFQNWGEAKPHRPTEDLAFATARFFAEGGTYVGYYMWHGGTNFGRSAGGPFQMTSYDYDAPIDEFGFANEPKYSHLKALHEVINANSEIILNGQITRTIRDDSILVTSFNSPANNSIAPKLVLISNTNAKKAATVQFEGKPYDVPKWSVTFVVDGTVVYNTAKIQAASTKQVLKEVASPRKTFSIREQIGIWDESLVVESKEPLDQITLTKDLTDYCLYQTDVVVSKSTKTITISIQEAQDWVMIYLDDEFVASRKGAVEVSFAVKNKYYQKSDELRKLVIKTQTLGLINNMAHSQNYKRGLIGPVVFNGQDITRGNWKHQVGLEGELKDFINSPDIKWTNARQKSGTTWYKFELDEVDIEPESAYVLDMSFASKGQVWFNGNHLGRYWDIIASESKLDPKESLLTLENLQSLVYDKCEYSEVYSGSKCRYDVGEPSQRYYHVPREWISVNQPNTVVIFEEVGLKDSSVLKLLQVHRE